MELARRREPPSEGVDPVSARGHGPRPVAEIPPFETGCEERRLGGGRDGAAEEGEQEE